MADQKLLSAPSMFSDVWLNQTPIDLSRRKIALVSLETSLIKDLERLERQLFWCRNEIESIDSFNESAKYSHEIVNRMRNGS